MSLGFASHLEDPDLDRVSAALVRRRAGEHPGVPGVNYVGLAELPRSIAQHLGGRR
jgi:hypothetical protein